VPSPLLYVVFLASGFAALLYQVVWQRSLFAIYGINIESVTIVVTAFMLGLGLGSLAGGAISRNPKRPVLLLFSMVELGIGAYGLVSLPLFHMVGAFTLNMSPVATALITFLLVLVPTVLMGGTLPLLVAHFVRRSGNVGQSVGMLYFVNTLGSAAASLVSVLFVMGPLGQANTVRLAAAINVLVGLSVLALYMKTKKDEAESIVAIAEKQRSREGEIELDRKVGKESAKESGESGESSEKEGAT
jgi:predicted membrane-bound spermidine synthase